jgi:hypothetical protein
MLVKLRDELVHVLNAEHEVRALEPEVMRQEVSSVYSFPKLATQFAWKG